MSSGDSGSGTTATMQRGEQRCVHQRSAAEEKRREEKKREEEGVSKRTKTEKCHRGSGMIASVIRTKGKLKTKGA